MKLFRKLFKTKLIHSEVVPRLGAEKNVQYAVKATYGLFFCGIKLSEIKYVSRSFKHISQAWNHELQMYDNDSRNTKTGR